MGQDLSGNERLKRYLLGELPKHLRKQIEREFFEDTDFLRRLLDAEKKLIADYHSGALDARDRLLFEEQFQDATRRSQWVTENEADLDQALLGARGTRKDEAVVRREPSSWWSSLQSRLRQPKVIVPFALAATLLTLAAGLWAIYVWTRGTATHTPQPIVRQPDVTETPVEQPSPRQENSNAGALVETPDSANRPTPSPRTTPRRPPRSESARLPQPPRAVAALLVPGLVKGSEPLPTVSINPGDSDVLLRLRLFENKYNGYSADLRTEGKRLIMRLPASASEQHEGFTVVPFHVPAHLLVEDFYYLTLYGFNARNRKVEVDIYPFNVERR